MKEIEIIKLPTIGSPFSYKTRKQGRRGTIENDIKYSNDIKKKNMIKNNPNKEIVRKKVKEFILNYKYGSNKFLDSIKTQARIKGFDKLTDKQIEAVKKFANQ